MILNKQKTYKDTNSKRDYSKILGKVKNKEELRKGKKRTVDDSNFDGLMIHQETQGLKRSKIMCEKPIQDPKLLRKSERKHMAKNENQKYIPPSTKEIRCNKSVVKDKKNVVRPRKIIYTSCNGSVENHEEDRQVQKSEKKITAKYTKTLKQYNSYKRERFLNTGKVKKGNEKYVKYMGNYMKKSTELVLCLK